MEQPEPSQQIPVILEEVIVRLNALAENQPIKYEETEGKKVKCVATEENWEEEISLPVLLQELEDVYSEEQMKMIALGGEEGIAR